MTYLDYINQFHRVRRYQARRLTSNAADLYFQLLVVNNGAGWKESFNETTAMLLATLGMTDKTLDSARKLLIEAGLLAYTAGRKGTASTYKLLTVDENATENFRSNGGRNGGSIRGESGGETGDLHKNKIKNKKEGANAPGEREKKSAKKPATSPPPAPPTEPEPWLTWVLANAPDVQRMKEPLTGEQWAQLVAVYGEPMVQEVLAAMHNTAGAERKYKSANLTAQNWCKRRCPGGKPPKPAPKLPTSKPAPTAAPLAPEAVAENEAKAIADLARRTAEFQARQEPA